MARRGRLLDADYAPAPALPGRTELVGDWLRDQAAAQMRVVVATDQASRLAELVDVAGRIGPSEALESPPPPGASPWSMA